MPIKWISIGTCIEWKEEEEEGALALRTIHHDMNIYKLFSSATCPRSTVDDDNGGPSCVQCNIHNPISIFPYSKHWLIQLRETIRGKSESDVSPNKQTENNQQF